VVMDNVYLNPRIFADRACLPEARGCLPELEERSPQEDQDWPLGQEHWSWLQDPR